MNAESPTQRIVLLDTDHGAFVQLCRRLSAVKNSGFQLERQESWHDLQIQIDRGEVQAVLARAENLTLLANCGVPVIHLSAEPAFSYTTTSDQYDVLWDQSSSSEIITTISV